MTVSARGWTSCASRPEDETLAAVSERLTSAQRQVAASQAAVEQAIAASVAR